MSCVGSGSTTSVGAGYHIISLFLQRCRFMGYEALRNKMVDKEGKLTQARTVLCGLGNNYLTSFN